MKSQNSQILCLEVGGGWRQIQPHVHGSILILCYKITKYAVIFTCTLDRLMLACFAGQFDAVKLLRANGAKYDDYDRGGSTPIHWAVDGGNTRLIEWIIKDGADVNLKDHSHGWTPLIRCGKYLPIPVFVI